MNKNIIVSIRRIARRIYFFARKIIFLYFRRTFIRLRRIFLGWKRKMSKVSLTIARIIYLIIHKSVYTYPRRTFFRLRRIILGMNREIKICSLFFKAPIRYFKKKIQKVFMKRNTSAESYEMIKRSKPKRISLSGNEHLLIRTSVVVITRNRAHLLERCLRSFLLQTLSPSEIIVVDNASTDSTKLVVSSLSDKLPIRYVHESQAGIPYARNRGIKEATGDIILMIDDDCKASSHWVERMAKAHVRYPSAWVIQGRTFSVPQERIYSIIAEFNRALSIRSHAKNYSIKLTEIIDMNFSEEFMFSTCDTRNFSIKRELLEKYSLNFDKHFYRGSDSDLGKQIAEKKGEIIFSPQIMVNHFERSGLKEFLEQRWHIGKTSFNIERKWMPNTYKKGKGSVGQKLKLFLYYCREKKVLKRLPFLIPLFFLDRLYYFNGRLSQKSLAFHNANTHVE